MSKNVHWLKSTTLAIAIPCTVPCPETDLPYDQRIWESGLLPEMNSNMPW